MPGRVIDHRSGDYLTILASVHWMKKNELDVFLRLSTLLKAWNCGGSRRNFVTASFVWYMSAQYRAYMEPQITRRDATGAKNEQQKVEYNWHEFAHVTINHYQQEIPVTVCAALKMSGQRAFFPVTWSRGASCEGDAIYWSSVSAWKGHRTGTTAQRTCADSIIHFLNQFYNERWCMPHRPLGIFHSKF